MSKYVYVPASSHDEAKKIARREASGKIKIQRCYVTALVPREGKRVYCVCYQVVPG